MVCSNTPLYGFVIKLEINLKAKSDQVNIVLLKGIHYRKFLFFFQFAEFGFSLFSDAYEF